jgi:hypothetical protein
MPRFSRLLLAWLLGSAPLLGAPGHAWAHGSVTGAQDIVQDYGVMIFLLAIVLIGAGVVIWVLRAPPEQGDA